MSVVSHINLLVAKN